MKLKDEIVLILKNKLEIYKLLVVSRKVLLK
jgi:hypothetical protein